MPKTSTLSLSDSISGSLFEVASDLDGQGLIKQAIPAYLKVISHYPDGPDAAVATKRVLAIVDRIRQMGQHHVAMGVLDQLEAAHLSS